MGGSNTVRLLVAIYLLLYCDGYFFLFAFGLLNATITVLIRDYHIFLQSVLRLLFYVSGPIWDINNRNMPEWLIKLLRLNPFYYLIEGF